MAASAARTGRTLTGLQEKTSAHACEPCMEMAMWLSAMRTRPWPWASEMQGGAILWRPVRRRARRRKRAMSPGLREIPVPLAMKW